MKISRRLRTIGVGVVVGFGVLASGTSASAHVGIGEGEVAAGSYSILTFSVPHGCGESPTTQVQIQIPESIPTPTPTVNANWDVEKVMEALETPVDAGHGTTIDERVAEVVYTAKTPLPNGFRDAFELSVKIPDDAAGTTLYFPTVQTCEDGVTRWIEIPADGEDGEDLELPAPSVGVTEASGDAHGHGATTDDETAGDEAVEADTTVAEAADVTDDDADGDAGSDSGDGGTSAVTWIALATGVLGLAAGGFALARTR